MTIEKDIGDLRKEIKQEPVCHCGEPAAWICIDGNSGFKSYLCEECGDDELRDPYAHSMRGIHVSRLY
jgi:hypothetical protein